MERPLFIPVILGTARQGRESEHAARFVFEQTKKRAGVETEFVDIRSLPMRLDDAGEHRDALDDAFAVAGGARRFAGEDGAGDHELAAALLNGVRRQRPIDESDFDGTLAELLDHLIVGRKGTNVHRLSGRTSILIFGEVAIFDRTGKRGDQYLTLQVVLPDPPDAELEAFVTGWPAGRAYNPRQKIGV